MSTTGSMSSNPNDWIHFYAQNLNSSTPTPFTNDVPQVSEATLVTTTAGQFGSGNPSSGINNNNNNNNNRDLSPDQGRVSKPARKRSRASRRTPTTLLNTDTSNFRAMVQQFTGGPATASFGGASTSYPVGSGFGFGLGSRPQSFLVQQPHGYHPLQPQQQQQFHQQLQNQQYMLSLNNNNGGGGDGFVQRINTAVAGGGRMGPTSNGDDDGFSSGGIIRPMGSNSTNGNASSNSSFMF